MRSRSVYFPFLVLTVILWSCALTPTSPEILRPTDLAQETEQPIIISFGAAENERVQYEPLIAAFNTANPHIRVQFVALDEIFNRGSDADTALHNIAKAADTALIPSALLKRATNPSRRLYDLNAFVDQDATFNQADFYPHALAKDQQSGALYGIARELAIRLLFYNQSLWNQRGLPTPKPDWTWDDMLAAAEQLAQKSGNAITVYGLADHWNSGDDVLTRVFAAAGVNSLQPQSTDFDQPKTVLALNRMAALVDSGAVYMPLSSPPDTNGASVLPELIRNGRVAMWSGDIYTDPVLPFPIGVAVFPQPARPSSAETSHYVISAGTRAPDAAWRWLVFLSHQLVSGHANIGLQTATVVPARPSLAEQSGYWQKLDSSTGINGLADATRTALALPELADTGDQRLLQAIKGALIRIVAQEQSAQQSIVEIQAAWERRQAELNVESSPPAQPPSVITVATPVPEQLADGKIPIVFSFRENPSNAIRGPTMRRLARAFGEKYPAIDVQFKTYDRGDTSPSELASTSDCFAWDWNYEPNATMLTATLDLQPLIDADPAFYRDDYPDRLLDLFRYNGALTGLPDQVGFRVLYYNQAMFDTRGLDYPQIDWTLDDFLNAAQKLTYEENKTKYYGFASLNWQPNDIPFFLNRFGATAVRGQADVPEPDFTNPKAIEAIRFYVNLLRYSSPHIKVNLPVVNPHDDQLISNITSLAEEKRIGMWFNEAYSAKTPGISLSSTIRIAPPLLDAGTIANNDIRATGLFISAQTQQVEACWAWLKYLSKEPAHMHLQDWFPARRSVAESDAFLQQARLGSSEVYTAYWNVLNRDTSTSADQVTLEATSPALDTFWIFQAIEQAIQGKNLEDALEKAQTRTQAYVSCYQASKKWAECANQVDPQYQGYGILMSSP